MVGGGEEMCGIVGGEGGKGKNSCLGRKGWELEVKWEEGMGEVK